MNKRLISDITGVTSLLVGWPGISSATKC